MKQQAVKNSKLNHSKEKSPHKAKLQELNQIKSKQSVAKSIQHQDHPHQNHKNQNEKQWKLVLSKCAQKPNSQKLQDKIPLKVNTTPKIILTKQKKGSKEKTEEKSLQELKKQQIEGWKDFGGQKQID